VVAEHGAERHARGFSCWGQFVAMLFCRLGRAQPLREICGGLAASEGKFEFHDQLRAGCARSVYLAATDFELECRKGETVFLAKREYVANDGATVEWSAGCPGRSLNSASKQNGRVRYSGTPKSR
jgi:hypothetical protein